MKNLFRTGLAALVAGLIIAQAMADTENGFPPGGFEYMHRQGPRRVSSWRF